MYAGPVLSGVSLEPDANGFVVADGEDAVVFAEEEGAVDCVLESLHLTHQRRLPTLLPAPASRPRPNRRGHHSLLSLQPAGSETPSTSILRIKLRLAEPKRA